MNKPLKTSLIGIAGLLILVIAAAAIFVLTFDANRYKPQIERLVQEKTGRTLKLQGPLEAAIWPSLGAKVAGVTFSERGSEQQFVALDNAHAAVALLCDSELGFRELLFQRFLRLNGFFLHLVEVGIGPYFSSITTY